MINAIPITAVKSCSIIIHFGASSNPMLLINIIAMLTKHSIVPIVISFVVLLLFIFLRLAFFSFIVLLFLFGVNRFFF